jgi:hypothetical protein
MSDSTQAPAPPPAAAPAGFWAKALAWAGAHKKTLVLVAIALGGLVIGLLI